MSPAIRAVGALLLALSSPAFALDFSTVSCGDHFFKITAVVDATTGKALVSFSGDSNPNLPDVEASVSEKGSEIIFEFLNDSGESLVVDASDAVHDIYWGSVRTSDREMALGLCEVN
jgi:hypothetical protein